MPVLRIPTPLRAYTDGKSEVTVSGSNISDVLADLTSQYPALRPHLFNDSGDLRPFVNLFVGENNIKDLQGVDTPIKDGEKIMLIPSIAGGMSHLHLRAVQVLRGECSSRRSNTCTGVRCQCLRLYGGRHAS
jgi:molybdopterin converting factor small subunit